MLSPIGYYKQQNELHNQQLAAVVKRAGSVAMGRLWVAIAAIAVAAYTINTGINELWWGVAGLGALFLILVRKHSALSEEQEGIQLHLQVIKNELQALEGYYNAFADGAQFLNTIHPYSYDLDLFGKGSVYQMLCRAVTLGGERLLAYKLSQPTLAEGKIQEQQSIIKELSGQPGLLQQFRVAGMKEKEAPKDQTRLSEWLLSANSFVDDKLVVYAAMCIPVLSLAFILYSFYIGTLFTGLFAVFIINGLLLRRYAGKMKMVAQQVGNTTQLIGKFERLLQQCSGQEFSHPYLQGLSEKSARSLAEIARFRKLVNLFDSRNNNMVGPLMNMFFLFNFTCILRLEKWKRENSALLLDAIALMVEADTYISCAVYAFNNPENTYPEISKGKEIIVGDLRHPLLPAKIAVGNTFSLGQHEQFYLLTGANMTGKSTFIRTLGVSIVLFNVGLPLPAKEVSLPIVDLYTSMRVTDSVQDDISYFKAELNRIQSLMGAVKTAAHPYLILLDEPLRGTNSVDKQQGTRAIVDNLLGYNAIGIVATHDTILCDMEDVYPGKVSNYHFESKVEKTGLSFDFKLKEGVSVSNNATLLMRQMGIITG